jgi:plastocyanin
MRRSRPAPRVGTQLSLASLGLAAVLAAVGACFSERQPVTGPPSGSTAACTIPVNSPIIGSTVAIVAIRDYDFQPHTITVRAGTTVTWVNCEPVGIDAHTTTSNTGDWDSPFLEPGDTYSHTFGSAGTFDYHCVPHASMQAVVIVQ